MNVLRRPTFTTTVRVEYADWLEENRSDLEDWYRITSEWSPEQHPGDFDEFCRVQFDIACEADERLREGLYEAQLTEADAEDESNLAEAAYERSLGECYRGGEAAGALAEEQARIQRDLK